MGCQTCQAERTGRDHQVEYELRYKQLSESPDGMQEYMEDYIPQFVPAHLRHHVDYFFDVYDAEEKRMET